MKIVEHCTSEVPILTVVLFWSARQGEDSGISDSIISKIPILTVALFWSAMTGCSQNRDLRYNRIRNFHYLHLF